ncbi:carboxylic ester hydrolase-9 [Teratosphaeria destructans]|uniref:Carboxylic ester hydrolase n=1 Tax=Teratosphaeria destructans TaxID=418781 RepID=A0A9W7T1H7_9PEZI|nr:carboxylic ester hydrolase-9 [Teratosphaeria destructans]
MTPSLRLLTWSLLAAIVPFVSAQGTLTAELDYGTFAGAYSANLDIAYWRKIPFAAPPTGRNRFRAPQPPLPITGAPYNTDQPFESCPQRGENGSEDCLYLGIFGRPWTTGRPLRPVVVAFYGGGLIQGGGSFLMPPAGYPVLNVSTENDLVFVYPNYRVNAFGFLPGREIADDPESDLNVGLLDQQAVLQWVQKYIAHFGGDAGNVGIWGQSAGAGSVVAQVIANGGDTQPRLFNKALASSPFWPKTYRYDAPEAQDVYDTFARLANCAGPDSLHCLKTADVQTLRTAALGVSKSHTYKTSSFTWAPVIGDTFLPQSLSQAIVKGQVNADFVFNMYNQHEGENFNYPRTVHDWLHGFLPGLSEPNYQKVLELYPAKGTAEDLQYDMTHVRTGLIYRDTVLACPALWSARAALKRSHLGQYIIAPARHGSDTQWWNQVNLVQKTNPFLYQGYTGAFASFFQTGDPNAHKLTPMSVAGVPDLKTMNQEFVIYADGFATVDVGELRSRCDFWLGVAGEIPL